MSNTETVCLTIHQLEQKEKNGSISASLDDSARCGCRYCGAVCEARPERAKPDKVNVWLNAESLGLLFRGSLAEYIHRDLFILHPQDDPIIPMSRCIPGNTGSRQSFETIRGWLDTCLATHTSLCSALYHGDDGSPKLPHRVIEVSLDTPRQIRLIHAENRTGRYACLSHCWGGQQPLKTTREPDTLTAHLQNIQEKGTPKTFQDAITVIIELGIRYIWIDSLCIIQDDETDWQIQSAQMAEIYANSTITLAASASSSPQEGLFRVAQNAYISQSLSSACNIHVRQPLEHWTGNLPLLQRGWVFQERLLSPRILHFARDELIWECMEFTGCECGKMDDHGSALKYEWLISKEYFNPIRWRLLKEDRLEAWKTWSELTKEYTQLKLSKPSDIFPAISGIAKSFAKATGWEYVAGMWKETMIYDLSWYVDIPVSRCVPWRSPTFSWASISTLEEDGLGLRTSHVQWQNRTTLATVMEAKVCPTGDDPTGQLESGYIILSGTLIQATVRHVFLGYKVENFPLGREGATRFELRADFDLMQPGYEVKDGETVFCLGLFQEEKDGSNLTTYLVLSKKSSRPWEFNGMMGEYEFERIGMSWAKGSYGELVERRLEEASPEYAIQHNATVKII